MRLLIFFVINQQSHRDRESERDSVYSKNISILFFIRGETFTR